ncbi:MAG: hypothetical protein CSA18_02460 [Deltaproteobacteria bacterium]|nr:MAG: hypothetical protein CSB21_01005 [Deltaproteobacteria bacterium]PIE74990.1 MAG: hypothetical protein CSA18_02460 [Deltaproteobacteria bacterium]
METRIEITSWKGAVFVIGLVIFAFWMHNFIYYYNPKLDETRMALRSDDPAIIAEALLEIKSLGMAKGHKLIPDILVLLGDERPVPEEIAKKMMLQFKSMPGAIFIPGIEDRLKKILTIGHTAAIAIQGLVIIDVHHLRWIGGKAKKQIVSYVTKEIDPADEYTLSNGLIAVGHIHRERLIPFWFDCLAIESEPIRLLAMSGLSFYIYDRTHGLWTWKPEKEISSSMLENLKLCLEDPYPHIRQEAADLIFKLKKAGLPVM